MITLSYTEARRLTVWLQTEAQDLHIRSNHANNPVDAESLRDRAIRLMKAAAVIDQRLRRIITMAENNDGVFEPASQQKEGQVGDF